MPSPLLLVVTGPIGAGKSTVATLVARRLARASACVAVVDLDDIAFMQHCRALSVEEFWASARLAHAAVVREWFRAGADVVIPHGPLVTADELAPLLRVARACAAVRHVSLRVPYDVALARVRSDDDRADGAMSRDPEFLRTTHEWFASLRAALRPDWDFDTTALAAGDIADEVAKDLLGLLHNEDQPGLSNVALRVEQAHSGSRCRAILEQLPTWFGVPEAVDGYVADADSSPSIIASVDGDDVGIAIVKRLTPDAAEVHLMAVVPALHGRGIGTAMLAFAERDLFASGVEFLQVKTLSASHPDEGYARTRAFYEAYGFRALEEWPDLWDASNPAVQLVKRVGG